MFWTRLVSGIVLLALAIATMAYGNIFLIVPLYIIAAIAYRELTKALALNKDPKKWNLLEIAGELGIPVYYVSCFLVAVWGKDSILLLGVIMGVFMVQMLIYVAAFPKYEAGQVMAAFFSFVYAPVMLGFIFLTREIPSGIGIYIVWLILISSWGCDTCAYAVGVLIGKHKIFPELSPKKSLEGCIGGVAGAALLGGLYGYFLVSDALLPTGTRSVQIGIVMAVICGAGAVMSMVGDLAASAIKRNHNIKDYGKIIPGHGGIMDRFDSMIVTAPITFFLATVLMQF